MNGSRYNITGKIKSSYGAERGKKDNTISSDINGVVFSYISGEISEGQFIMDRMKAKNFLKLQKFLKLPPNWNENENEYVINIAEDKKLKELVEDFYARD